MKEIAKLSGFKYLDSAAIYMDRGDLHLETNHGYDCLNYCYTPETYIPEVVLINKLLRWSFFRKNCVFGWFFFVLNKSVT